MDCSPPGPSVHGISQARMLGWVAISSSRGSSPPGWEPSLPLRLLHWQAASSPLSHLGNLRINIPPLQNKKRFVKVFDKTALTPIINYSVPWFCHQRGSTEHTKHRGTHWGIQVYKRISEVGHDYYYEHQVLGHSWIPEPEFSLLQKFPSPYLHSPLLPCNNPFEQSLSVLKGKKKALGIII